MRRIRNGTVLVGALLLVLAGCATVQTDEEWARVGSFAKERIGAEARWEQTAEDAQATQAEVNTMLADGLERREAVQIAVMNNRALQAVFEELGVAKADLVQAGFFTNPHVDGLVRFPTEGGRANVEAGGLINIADLWQIPVRKRLAATRLEAATLRVTDELLGTVAGAKRAYDDAVALAAARRETARVLKALGELRDQIARRKEYGYTSDFDIAFARAAVFDQEAALARVEGEFRVARIHLNRVLGLAPEQAGYALAGSLSEDVGPMPDAEALVAHALAQRPDVRLAELEIAISERALDLEKARVFTNVEVGAAYERETDGADLVGPAVGLQLPIFDQNQAQIAKAAFRLRQALKQRQAVVGMVREEVVAAAERLAVARNDALLIRERVIPAYRSALDYGEKYFGSMQLNMLFLLEARKELFANSRRYIDALREARAAEVDLERALGGTILEGGMHGHGKGEPSPATPQTVVTPREQTGIVAGGHGAMPHGEMKHGEIKHGEMMHGPMEHGGTAMHQAGRSTLGNPREGKEIYQRLCASCHGASGKGDGPAGRFLNPKPIDFTKHARHHGDEYFFKAIQEGGAAVGKSPVMPAWGSQLKPEEIWDVISHIRTLAEGHEGHGGHGGHGSMPHAHPEGGK